MHILEILPVRFGTPPGHAPAECVACGAGAPNDVVGNDRFVIQHSVLGHVHDGLGLFRRKSVVCAEVFDDRARIGGGDGQAVETHHALDCFLPALGSRALPRDAREISFVVFRVAGAAL